MKRFLQGSNWLIGALILTMPISLIYFLGSQMAYSQVQNRYEVYAEIPEYTSITELQSLEDGQAVMLRGKIAVPTEEQLLAAASQSTAIGPESQLFIFQERPLDGREVRFREGFPLIFPEFTLTLLDGDILIAPRPNSEYTISHELHRTTWDDREFTGFQAGDTITVQGLWRAETDSQSIPLRLEVTGISGIEKAALLAEVQAALKQVSQGRLWLGLLTLVSMILLVAELIRRRKRQPPNQKSDHDNPEREKEWQPPIETVPTTRVPTT